MFTYSVRYKNGNKIGYDEYYNFKDACIAADFYATENDEILVCLNDKEIGQEFYIKSFGGPVKNIANFFYKVYNSALGYSYIKNLKKRKYEIINRK